MSQIESLFVTRLYRAALTEFGKAPDAAELRSACLSIADDDEAGQEWCVKHGYPGYTSYASLADLAWRFPTFKDLVKVLDKHVAAFVKDLQFDLGGKKVKLDSLWINILPTGGVHTSHLHPHSVSAAPSMSRCPGARVPSNWRSAVGDDDGCPCSQGQGADRIAQFYLCRGQCQSKFS
jgi:uncharacterized protein (TIGR02466 family)